MSFGIKLHEYLYGDWDQVKDALVQELDYLHNSLRLNWDSVFDENNSLNADAFLGDSTIDTVYISNEGPGHSPKWARINLANGVKGRLEFLHFVQGTAETLVGRGEGAGSGDYQQITLGTGLQMTGTQLSVDAFSGGTGSTPYFIPVGITHTIALYFQELFQMTIDVEGILDVEGFLIQVD